MLGSRIKCSVVSTQIMSSYLGIFLRCDNQLPKQRGLTSLHLRKALGTLPQGNDFRQS